MMEMKRELKKLQVTPRRTVFESCCCTWLSQTGLSVDLARWQLTGHSRSNSLHRLSSRAQRIREQIRTWANDATIRDTSLLIEARRAIEHQMVWFSHTLILACHQ